jgi:hypothetical protein
MNGRGDPLRWPRDPLCFLRRHVVAARSVQSAYALKATEVFLKLLFILCFGEHLYIILDCPVVNKQFNEVI